MQFERQIVLFKRISSSTDSAFTRNKTPDYFIPQHFEWLFLWTFFRHLNYLGNGIRLHSGNRRIMHSLKLLMITTAAQFADKNFKLKRNPILLYVIYLDHQFYVILEMKAKLHFCQFAMAQQRKTGRTWTLNMQKSSNV